MFAGDYLNDTVMELTPVEMMSHDMKGCIIHNVTLYGKEGWLLNCYKVMPCYKVQHLLRHVAGTTV